jgi:hypothetical protein
MKYNLVISRTYVTEIEVTANSEQEALEWLSANTDYVYEQELEQCNVIEEEVKIQEKVIVHVYEHLSIELTINERRDGYYFKTPIGFGGRHYYSFCNDVDNAFAEQYSDLEYELRMNLRNN